MEPERTWEFEIRLWVGRSGVQSDRHCEPREGVVHAVPEPVQVCGIRGFAGGNAIPAADRSGPMRSIRSRARLARIWSELRRRTRFTPGARNLR